MRQRMSLAHRSELLRHPGLPTTRGRLCRVTVLAALTLGPGAAEEPRVELEDGFAAYGNESDGSPRWMRYMGRWVMREGRCEQADVAARSAYLFLPGLMLSDVDFTVRFKALPKGGGVRTPGMPLAPQVLRA